MRWIDPRIRNEDWTDERKEIWYEDQYDHPHEEDYSHIELKKWFEEENITFIEALPKFYGSDSQYNFYMLSKMGSQGGLFIFIGRK